MFGGTAYGLAMNQATRDVFDQHAAAAEAARKGALEADAKADLFSAAKDGAIDEVRRLLGAGADVNYQNSWEQTALHLASENGHVVVVKLLLKAGAVVDTKDFGTYTALHWASQNGHGAVVKLLLEAGAGVDVKARNGKMAYDLAKDQAIRDVFNQHAAAKHEQTQP